ncbi:MAG: ubiquinol-cytochrome C chaperone family protein [Pseudomonadota bacterium]
MILSLFKRNDEDIRARELYSALIDISRQPYFFEKLKAPDTVEGRFEILSIHVYLTLRRLKGAGKNADSFAQAVFDTFFKNMDDALRELGVGDMSIGRKIRGLAEAFYGRIGAYEKALDEGDRNQLSGAISRNVYERESHPMAPAIADYMVASIAALDAQTVDTILAATIEFPDVEALHTPEGASE